jgi:hypothetical protein
MGKMKDGNKKIRWILTQAANTAFRTDDRLRKFYLRVAKRHGHNIAITHVANTKQTASSTVLLIIIFLINILSKKKTPIIAANDEGNGNIMDIAKLIPKIFPAILFG